MNDIEKTTPSAADTAEQKAATENRSTSERSAERRSGGRRTAGRFQRRRKFCKFCADKTLVIDHKDPDLLRQMITERYKILPARVTGTCARHQRQLTTAIKRARILALLPFTPLHHD